MHKKYFKSQPFEASLIQSLIIHYLSAYGNLPHRALGRLWSHGKCNFWLFCCGSLQEFHKSVFTHGGKWGERDRYNRSVEIDSYIHRFDRKINQNFVQNFLKKFVKNAPKMLSERFQVGSRRPLEATWGSGPLPKPLWNRFWSDFGSKNAPKLVQNRSKIDQESKKYWFQNQLWIRCHFLIDFWSNFNRFWCQNCFQFWSNFKITCDMLNMLKC